MSPKHSIEGLGTHSDYGKDVGKERCLQGYLEALDRWPSSDKGWNRLERKKIIRKIEKERNGK
jgi:hypothetical protein